MDNEPNQATTEPQAEKPSDFEEWDRSNREAQRKYDEEMQNRHFRLARELNKNRNDDRPGMKEYQIGNLRFYATSAQGNTIFQRVRACQAWHEHDAMLGKVRWYERNAASFDLTVAERMYAMLGAQWVEAALATADIVVDVTGVDPKEIFADA